jgi:addiction module HigA family antidote
MTKIPAGLPAIHPGVFLREDVLPHFGKRKVEIAAALGITRAALDDILKEQRAITPAMALKLEALFGASAETWLRLQAAYDLASAKPELRDTLAAIPRWTPATPVPAQPTAGAAG